MLKGIPPIIPPELLKIMMEMGHGDEIVIADGNFPSARVANRLVRCDGHGVPEILSAILQLFPLDTYAESPVVLMQVVPGDNCETPIWDEYRKIIDQNQENVVVSHIDRFPFYDRAKEAYAVVATGERALYANIILKKGVVKE